MNSFDLKSQDINNRMVKDLRKTNINEQVPEGQDIIIKLGRSGIS